MAMSSLFATGIHFTCAHYPSKAQMPGQFSVEKTATVGDLIRQLNANPVTRGFHKWYLLSGDTPQEFNFVDICILGINDPRPITTVFEAQCEAQNHFVVYLEWHQQQTMPPSKTDETKFVIDDPVEREAATLLVKHPFMPLTALWHALLNPKPHSFAVSMAIVNHEQCGLHRHSVNEKIGSMSSKGFTFNAKRDRATPLTLATVAGRLDIMDALLQAGAPVNYEVQYPRPLSVAISTLNIEGVRLLIKFGADVNGAGDGGDSPLHTAAGLASGAEIVDLLICKGAKIDMSDKFGNTPLHAAANKGVAKTIEILMAKGADINAENYEGATPLLLAAIPGKCDVIQTLLSAGANPNLFTSPNALTALHHLAGSDGVGASASVHCILNAGCSVNLATLTGRTALHLSASEAGHLDITEALLDSGADVAALDNKGRSAFLVALGNDREDTMQLLRSEGLLA